MDDSCAVCAESLEWVAYGACGHREVCSTCVSRLRFICEDRRCCICKTESDVVFVTKALGDYTKTINDFSVFPSNSTEGRSGSYWFHEDTGAYFDDVDHYNMVKAMCRLSCSVCDNIEEQPDGSKRKAKFRNIEQLKGHLNHRHKLFMCNLCLEGRKIFICEQKLYTKAQLNQHIRTGDSDVDGTESDRGGFMGHPMCEFCRKPFYGDNELYSHMSTEHYTCHICQRQNPGQFEYYRNYDDLENHFSRKHFLCENEGCLAKKFIVFASESEMKRHNAVEHGGHMSRSKRNAVLQIPTSFRYRRSNEQDHRRGRGRIFHPDSSETQLSMAIQASLEASATDNRNHDPSSSAQPVPDQRETSDVDEIVAPFEAIATTDSDGSSRYRQALGQGSRNVPLEESSFPPLPVAPTGSKQKQNNEGLSKNTLAARLRGRNKGTVNVLNSGTWSATTHGSASSSSVYSQARATSKQALVPSSSFAGPSLSKTTTSNDSISSHASSAQARTSPNHGLASSSSASSSLARPAVNSGPISSSYASTAQARPTSGSMSWNASGSARIGHSVSAPNLVEKTSLDSSMSEFPPVSSTQKNKLPASSPMKVEDVRTANKSLVERIRSALGCDENKYTKFKELSADFRLGVLGTAEYLSYVQDFGLSHLVFELASLCPDSKKQRELLDTYNASVRFDIVRENDLNISRNKGSNKGKGKFVEESNSGSKEKISVKSSKDTLADDIIGTVKKLQANYKPLEEVEVLSKDGYRRSNGNLKIEPLTKSNGLNDIHSAGAGSGSSTNSSGAGSGKQRKKTSKFHRVRLGNGFEQEPDDGSEHEDAKHSKDNSNSEAMPVRGVWRNGGGQRLVALTQKDPAK